jgi:hypothetical protein
MQLIKTIIRFYINRIETVTNDTIYDKHAGWSDDLFEWLSWSAFMLIFLLVHVLLFIVVCHLLFSYALPCIVLGFVINKLYHTRGWWSQPYAKLKEWVNKD